MPASSGSRPFFAGAPVVAPTGLAPVDSAEPVEVPETVPGTTAELVVVPHVEPVLEGAELVFEPSSGTGSASSLERALARSCRLPLRRLLPVRIAYEPR